MVKPPPRSRWILWHVLLAGFVTPALLLYLATGLLYTWETKGTYSTSTVELAPGDLDLDRPALEPLEQFARTALDAQGIPWPSGEARIRRAGTSWEFEWTGIERDVLLSPTAAGTLNLAHKQTDAWRHLVQLHKAKGGAPFKWFAILWVLAAAGVLALGYLAAWRVPTYRRASLLATAAGLLTALAAALAS